LGFRKYPAKIAWNANLMVCKECHFITNQNLTQGLRNPRVVNDMTNIKGISKIDFSQKNIRKLMESPVLIGSDDPLHILKIRFARGEVSKDEFREMRKLLEE
jgi:hypothetical protein